jgi:hypothetical protein
MTFYSEIVVIAYEKVDITRVVCLFVKVRGKLRGLSIKDSKGENNDHVDSKFPSLVGFGNACKL